MHFYESLAHNLTISARMIWSNDGITDSEKVDQLKWLNEIQHRVTAKIQVERIERHEWPESEFIEMANHYVKLCPGIARIVAAAISESYECLDAALDKLINDFDYNKVWKNEAESFRVDIPS